MSSNNIQAKIFVNYLTGQRATPTLIKRYKKFSSDIDQLNEKDKRILAFIERHPSSISLIDAGLISIDPYSQIRKRLYIMLALLESDPDYSDKFIPTQKNIFYFIFIVFIGIRAVFRTIIGLILLRIIT